MAYFAVQYVYSSDAELVARRLTDGGILYTLTAIAPTRANTVERSRSMPATT